MPSHIKEPETMLDQNCLVFNPNEVATHAQFFFSIYVPLGFSLIVIQVIPSLLHASHGSTKTLGLLMRKRIV